MTETKGKKAKKLITKDMPIGEVLQKYGYDVARVMMLHGMHCVGCHAAMFETIEQGCLAHGMSEEQINKMVEEMNEVVSKAKKAKKVEKKTKKTK